MRAGMYWNYYQRECLLWVSLLMTILLPFSGLDSFIFFDGVTFTSFVESVV